MEQTDLISVIIPAYNAENYIKKCLKSILHQTYRNIQVILVDDDSTDKTAEIAKDIMEKDDRCLYIYEENAGLSAARNMGFNYAKGEYITFVDADDYCELQMLERLYHTAKTKDVDLTICGAIREEEDNGQVLSTDNLSCNEYIPAINWMLDCYTAPDKTWIVRVWGKLYRKSMIEDVPFHNGKIYEDQLFLADVLNHVGAAAVVNEPLYHYVSHASSIVNKPKTDKDFDAVRGAIYVFDRISFLGLTDYLPGAEGKIYAKMLELKKKSGKEWKKFPSYKPVKEEHIRCLKELKLAHKLKIKTIFRDTILYFF